MTVLTISLFLMCHTMVKTIPSPSFKDIHLNHQNVAFLFDHSRFQLPLPLWVLNVSKGRTIWSLLIYVAPYRQSLLRFLRIVQV